MLQQSYDQQNGTTSQQTRYQIEMVAMSQQLEAKKQDLNTLAQKQKELDITKADRPDEVSISTPSRLRKDAIGPARLRSIILAFLVSLVAGVGLAFLLDFLDDTVKSIDDVDRYIHLPALALIPTAASEKPRLRGKDPTTAPSNATALALVSDVRSPIGESYRH